MSKINENESKIETLKLDIQFTRAVINDITTLSKLAMENEDEIKTIMRVVMGYSVFALDWSENNE